MTREDDELRAVRRERHLRRLGTRHPRCATCGETEPAALTLRGTVICCYECVCAAAGRSTVEHHHVAGQHNDTFTVPLPGNVHRLVSDAMHAWPPATIQNPHASPLRRAAAWIRGVVILLRVLAERTAWVPPFLERLDERLSRKHGERWWEQPELEDTDQ